MHIFSKNENKKNIENIIDAVSFDQLLEGK
jgi:hypothetical protein